MAEHGLGHQSGVLYGFYCMYIDNLIRQHHKHAQYLKVNISGGPLDNQTWQTEWKTAPLAKVQLYEYENQTLKLLLQPAVCLPSLIVQWPARILHF